MKNVTIYSTSVCKYCNLAKDFFKENNISYTEYNVGTDAEKRKEMVDKSGQMGVPVIAINDDVVIGFNEPILRQLLLEQTA
ncbi:MAG: glutaredoxin family protein [Patescibacteria group bacterium]